MTTNYCSPRVVVPIFRSLKWLPGSSSSAFDVMVALTRSSLPWVLHTWMSGTSPLQTPRAWFWGTHKWAISAALLGGRVSRTAGHVLVFGLPHHRGIELRSLRQSSWVGYSVCSGLFWGERWWSVGWWSASWFWLYPPVLQWMMAFFLLRIRVFLAGFKPSLQHLRQLPWTLGHWGGSRHLESNHGLS